MILSAILATALQQMTPDVEFNPGHTTPDELVKLDTGYQAIEQLIEEMQAARRDYDYESALDLLEQHVADFRVAMEVAYLYDEVEPQVDHGEGETDPPPLEYTLAPVFSPGGTYEHLGLIDPDELSGAILGGPFKDWGGSCWASDLVCEFPVELWNRTVVFNDAAASWGEHGPERAQREVNATGLVRGITYWRPGDWTMGRDGHGFYWNVYRDATFEDCHVFEGGGQGWQMVWRDGKDGSHDETDIEWEDAMNWEHVVTIRDCSIVDCGQINFGSMAHASYPFAYYSPGQSLVIDGLLIQTEFPPVTEKGETFQSHGGVFIGPGQTKDRRTPLVQIDGLEIDIVRSDRTELVLWGVDEAILGAVEPISIIDQGGTADVKIVTTGEGACGTVEILAPLTDLHVHLMDQHPHKPPMETILVPAGTDYVWPPEAAEEPQEEEDQ